MPFSLVPTGAIPDRAGDRRHWQGLHGAAAGMAIAETARTCARMLFVVTPDPESAARLEQEIRFFLGDDEETPVLAFPDWETLPYDTFSAHQDIVSERLNTLARLPVVRRGVLITTAPTLMHRIAPHEYIAANSLSLDLGDRLDIDTFRRHLDGCGYRATGTVYEHGEYAVRGSIVDLFPMGSDTPFRVDLFDDEIETLRTFDPETQRTLETVASVRLLPARETPLSEDGISRFRQAFREHFDVAVSRCPVYREISDGIPPAGIEYYLPLFFEHTSTLFDYLPEDALAITLGDLQESAVHFWREAESRWEDHRVDKERPLLPPGELFLRPDDVFGGLKAMPVVRVVAATADAGTEAGGHHAFPCRPVPQLPVNAKAANPLADLERFLGAWPGRVLFAAESPGRREALLELLHRHDIRPVAAASWREFRDADATLAITVVPLEHGMLVEDPALAVITESQLFGSKVMQRRRRETRQDNSEFVVRSLAELRIGAPVVHIDHGVGRYLGMQNLSVDGQQTEFLCLEYAEEAKLYVPVSDLHLISRYSGVEEEMAPLHRLGSEQWQKARRKAAEKVRDTAAELLDLYARRQARKGRAFQFSEAEYASFAADFPFEETPDQENAIAAVIHDLRAENPMDRLVCGDVGFGKTEVALRAAWVAVSNGRQVVVLVPTTLLAQQHFETFRDRFADMAVSVEALSRFRTAKEQEAVLERAASGRVDILIGTHKLLQAGMRFSDLGLVIIDEEHRFGVRQKEKLKAMRAEVDILTLTATPIPRTLNMAMAGMRDLSVIATPPARRLSVKTFVRERNKGLIKEALLREILRGGQVYFLHNEVKSIERAARELAELVPEARVGVAHGQMRERDLERVMSDFYHRRFNVLVCSTIIETGIDIPSANTIVIERADRFGLAQLHQLRGRVGRSHHQAYAYLLTPHPKAMTPDAVKRLEAIVAAGELGAGFTLATHDMEIRGAGELLGDEQSGHIQAIGVSLFMDMLERAVDSIRSGRTPNLDQPLSTHSQINLRIPALLPDEYVPDVHTRLVLYKRISAAKTDDELRELRVELIDRFGLLPEAAQNLFIIASFRLRADAIGIERVDAGAERGFIEFSSHTGVEPLTLVKMVQAAPREFQLRGGNQLHFEADMHQGAMRVQRVGELLDQLLPAGNNASAA